MPTFDWKDVSCMQDLGVGSFGSVHSAKFVQGTEKETVVIKKLRGESDESKRRFVKEGEMLNSIKHVNVPRFYAFSDAPFGLMMEYAAFDFTPFGFEKTVSTLEDFYHFIDYEFDFESFADVITICLRDVAAGLEFLHKMDIAHRDLKPSNILVSNQHYCNKDKVLAANEYEHCPIVCKVADFGLSRSLQTQTQTIVESRTSNVHRGTPAYMAPEICTSNLATANQSDLKKMDIWSLGLVAFAMVNPNLMNPYCKEAERLGGNYSVETMKCIMLTQQLPQHDQKYESVRVTQWWQVVEVFTMCAKFDPDSRPSAEEVLRSINIDDPEASLLIKPLTVSQNTALENFDVAVAHQLENESSVLPTEKNLGPEEPHVLNEGTNACAFLAIVICDKILGQQKTVLLSHTDLTELADDVIKEFPEKVNKFRDPSKTYDKSEAKTILETNGLLSQQYELSEEFVSNNPVFSEAGSRELITALNNVPHNTIQLGIYTCPPYTFTVGLHNESYFIADTHPVGKDVGGNGNGICVATYDRSPRSCRLICQWILKRLALSGVNGKMPQSLSWLTMKTTSNGMISIVLYILKDMLRADHWTLGSGRRR